MSIADPLVLPVDVEIIPVANLPAGLRTELGADDHAFAICRPRGRHRAKLLDAAGAALLEEFRTPARAADVIRSRAHQLGENAERLLEAAFPLLKDCFNHRFLVSAGSPDAAPILPTRERGDRIGPYEIVRCLQVLWDNEVYLARDDDRQPVALKLVRPNASQTVTRQMRREAAALRHLSGRGAPSLLETGRFRRRPWIALSWIPGVTVDLAASERREMTSGSRHEVLRLARAVARCYADLHSRSVLHGDIHPRNLLVDREGMVWLIDFGLARPLPPLRLGGRRGDGTIERFLAPETATRLRLGSPSRPPDPAREQYSVAALLYEIFTGLPYTDFAADRDHLLRQVETATPMRFSERGIEPWPQVEEILARALAKSPGDRYPSCEALADALDAAAPSVVAPPRATGDPDHYLTDRFLALTNLDGPVYATWPAQAEPPTSSITFGSAGVAFALYRLACSRGDGELLAAADAWLCLAERHSDTPEAFAAPDTALDLSVVGPVSPYHAVSGVHVVRALLDLAYGDTSAARSAALRYIGSTSLRWTNADLTLGWAGVLLGATLLLEALPGRDIVHDRLRNHGDTIVVRILEALDRRKYPGGDREAGSDNLAMAHGWAGMLWALLRYAGATGGAPVERIWEWIERLSNLGEARGRGIRWWQPGTDDPWHGKAGWEIPGWCNGPAGFIHLWTLANKARPSPAFDRLAVASGWSTWDDRGRAVDLCCGLAGRSYGLLALYRSTGDSGWLDRARALFGRATRIVRTEAPTLERPLSLYRGLGGLAVLNLDLESPEVATMPFFDPEGWPNPEPAAHG